MAEPERPRDGPKERVLDSPTCQPLSPKVSGNLKQASSTHTSPHTHGDNNVFDAPALAFDQGVADKA